MTGVNKGAQRMRGFLRQAQPGRGLALCPRACGGGQTASADDPAPSGFSPTSQMYTDENFINIVSGNMALQIANAKVVAKVERLAQTMGLSKTALVETAVDHLAAHQALAAGQAAPQALQWAAILAQLQQLPDRADAYDAAPWGPDGLPR